jgi:hypothetical protein
MSDPLRMLEWVSSVRFYPLARQIAPAGTHIANSLKFLERAKGFEPSTPTLAGCALDVSDAREPARAAARAALPRAKKDK